MSYDDRLDESALTVLLDVRHPFAYLALASAAAFGRALGLATNWLPIVVSPLSAPSTPGPDDDRGVRHRRHRAHMIAREIETYAEIQGLTIREPYRVAETPAVDLAWLWLREQAPEGLEGFLLEAFRAYWALELDAADVEAVAALVDGSGGDRAAFLGWATGEGPEVAGRLADALRARGLTGAPGYYVAGEYFQGRQHLPMIRWILQGRRGQGPI